MEDKPASRTRLFDRVTIAIPIRIFGSDLKGRAYSEEGRTLEVSRNGALIAIPRELIPQEEVVLRVEATGKEAAAQIVGQVRRERDELIYGVKLVDPSANLWDINFPPLSESGRAVMRTLLECAKCHRRDVVHLEEFETEVFLAHRYIYHDCPRCRESTIWNETAYGAADAPVAASRGTPSLAFPAPSPKARTVNERRHVRTKCQLRACIRFRQNYPEEVLQLKNISRGGVCFATAKNLSPGTRFDIAVPYSPEMANIFVPAEVVRVRPLPNENRYEIGAAYVRP